MRIVIAVVVVVVVNVAVATQEERTVPSFDYDDLVADLNGLSSDRDVVAAIADASRNVGAFLIRNFPGRDEYVAALNSLESGAEACFASADKIVSLNVSPAVVRSTSAVASSDESTSHPACVASSADVVETSMDAVGNVVHQLIDGISGSKCNYKLPADPERVIPLSASDHLDHIHLYASAEDNDEPTAALHTDNGLFLLATPSAQSPLHVVDSNGDTLTTLTAEPAVVVLFGRALNDWLLAAQERVLFRPAPHFVPALKAGKKRLIVARMYVAPKEAVPAEGTRQTTFGKFFMNVEDPQLSPSNLCPSVKSRHRSMTSAASAKLWRSARSTFCDQGQAFCWMACLPLDSECSVTEQSCYNMDHKPCCLEGQTADDGCLDMDFTCGWHCN